MATVKEIIDDLMRVPADKRNLPVICVDLRSGDSNEVSVSSHIATVTGHENAGVLIDMEKGSEYVSAYVG